jgi:cell wall assembly regulator SMI1
MAAACMADALTLALDTLAQLLVREGDSLERELAASTRRNPDFTWPDDAPALHESARTWFRWRDIESAGRRLYLWLVLPLPERREVHVELFSPEAALERWRERSAEERESFLEIVSWLHVHPGDGSVWAYRASEDEESPPRLVRVADSLLQSVELTTAYYAARARSPWRALRFDSSSEPLVAASLPDEAQLRALPTGTAYLLRWRRMSRVSSRTYDNALLGVRVGDDQWLLHDRSTPQDSPEDTLEEQIRWFRLACYEEPTCLSSGELARHLQEASEGTRTRKFLDLHRGRVRVWQQGELGRVLERLRSELATPFPDVASSLREGASQETIQKLEAAMGYPLPEDLRGLLSWADGQAAGSRPFRLNMRLLSATEMEAEAHSMRGLQRDGLLQPYWWDAGFLPFCSNGNGDYFCLDLRGVYGPVGSVLEFFHKDDLRRVEAASLSQWLEAYVDGLEAGHWGEEDGRITPINWDGVKAFERIRTPGYPREWPFDAVSRWLPTA